MAKHDFETQDELKYEARRLAERFFESDPNITSYAVAEKITKGKNTGKLCIRFTVKEKLDAEALKAQGLKSLPKSLKDSKGNDIPVDVVQRDYKIDHRLLTSDAVAAAELSPREQRRSKAETVQPGLSVANSKVSAGTLGAIVYDKATGTPYALSNWHVLHGPNGDIDDLVVQPGRADDPNIAQNPMGRLVRSHLGLAGDCAISSIDFRKFDESIFGLDVSPKRIAKAEIGDKVVKSGRTTGVTRGIVSAIGITVRINYGGSTGVQKIGGFEITPDPNNLPTDGEVSMGGDSGSLWMIDGDAEEDIAVGLHFAGETDPTPSAEHAIACNIHSVFEKMNVSFTDDVSETVGHEDLFNEIFARLHALERRRASLAGPPSEGGAEASECETCGKKRSLESAPEALAIYGNWCGPGHGGGVPIDAVDGACMAHDKCYDQRGYFSCACDRDLKQNLAATLASAGLSPEARRAALAVITWFNIQPCNPFENVTNTVRRIGNTFKRLFS